MKATVSCLVGMLLLTGCATPETHYYPLHALQAPAPLRQGVASVEVGPVRLPASIDRPQLVLEGREGGALTILDQSRWAGPLPRMVAQTVADNLARALGASQVHAYPQPSPFPSDLKVLIDIRTLAAREGRGVHLDASWSILRDGKLLASGSVTDDLPPTGRGVQGLVGAHDAAMAVLARHIAQALAPMMSA